MKIVYLFCIDPQKDKVAPTAWRIAHQILPLKPCGFSADGGGVMKVNDDVGNEIFFVPTLEVVSHALDNYLPMLNGPFADCKFAGLVNWHEGGNAPDPIFCAHTNGDVPTGCFPKTDPYLTSRLLRSMAREAVAKGLDNWRTLPEATHFSGVQYGCSPKTLTELAMPLVDVELGSYPSSWASQSAAEAMILGISRAFETMDESLPVVLFIGGTHFEPSLAEGVVGTALIKPSCSFGHMLPNQWIASEAYVGNDGVEKLRAAVSSFCTKPDILVFHDGLKGPFKALVRAVAAELGIPCSNHRILRRGADAIRSAAPAVRV